MYYNILKPIYYTLHLIFIFALSHYHKLAKFERNRMIQNTQHLEAFRQKAAYHTVSEILWRFFFFFFF